MSVRAPLSHGRLWLALLAALPALAGEPGVKTEVIGGTVEAAPAKSSARLFITGAEALLLRLDAGELRIPYEKVNTLEYGQNVSRRYAAAILISPVLLLSKSRRHYVTLGYLDASGKQQALVIRVDKRDIRFVLAGLEARTGRRVEYQDNEARKSGKGS
jgi:hypothetical protein